VGELLHELYIQELSERAMVAINFMIAKSYSAQSLLSEFTVFY